MEQGPGFENPIQQMGYALVRAFDTNMAVPRFSGTAKLRIALKCHVTTAYYGGGVEAGAGDSLLPYRPTAIRGMLRWFWRATRGGAYADFNKLREREDEIWGATDKASRIEVDLVNGQLGHAVVARRRENERQVFEEPRYALFPAQSDVARTIYRGGSFELHIRYPEKDDAELRDDVNAALRHWLCFGGVGARTRRGLGSLYCPEFSGSGPYERMDRKSFLGDGATRGWSTCRGALLVTGKKTTHEQAWLEAIKVVQLYRQLRFGERGRSQWPEPDAIRRLRGQRASHHNQDMRHDDIYPRAALGLPIIFDFKTPGDPSPANTLVIDEERDRFASPVVAKPVAVSATESVPILLAYNTLPPPSLLLKQKGSPDKVVSMGKLAVIDGLLDLAAARWGATVYAL